MTTVEKIDLMDKKSAEKEIAQTKALQEAGLFPTKFDMPLTVQFELTTNCNLKCRHCYNMSNERVYDRTMTVADWHKVLDDLIGNGGVFQAIMSGGEPLLLGDDLFSLMDRLHDDGTSFVTISNGMLMSEEVVKKLKKYRFFWTQISIDGYREEYHDYFRGVKGSWQRATEAAFYLTKHGLPLKIAHCVTNDNVDDLEKMTEMAYHLGASGIILGENMKSGRAAKNDDTLMNRDERSRLLERIENLRNQYAGRMEVQRSYSLKNQIFRLINNPNTGCILRPNGDVRFDCVAPFVIGNLFETPFSQIWKEKSQEIPQHPLLKDFYHSISEVDNTSHLNTNYIDKEFRI